MPDGPPHLQQPVAVPPAPVYRPRDPVWVKRAGGRRPGVVLTGSAQAVTVRYRPRDSSGTGVETVLAADLAVRDDPDPVLDRPESDVAGWEAALPTRVVSCAGG